MRIVHTAGTKLDWDFGSCGLHLLVWRPDLKVVRWFISAHRLPRRRRVPRRPGQRSSDEHQPGSLCRCATLGGCGRQLIVRDGVPCVAVCTPRELPADESAQGLEG